MARHEEEALWALAAGELEAEARARVEAHVADCPACAQRLVAVRETQALLRTARSSEPQVRWAEVDDRILSAAARRFARLERRPRWPWALAAVGACAAMVLTLMSSSPGVAPRAPEQPVVAQREEAPAPPPAPEPSREEDEASAWVLEADGAGQALRAGTELRAGATVRTPSRGRARLRLPDASRMQVGTDSEVVLSRVEADDVRLRVVRGRVSVQASHAERRGFIVEAAGLRAVVVGTVFSVEHTPHGPAVSVLEGQVRVEAEGQPTQVASAGQRVELRARERTWRHRPLSAQDRRAFEALVQEKAPPLPRPVPAPEAPPPGRASPEKRSPAPPPAPAPAVSPRVLAWTEPEPAPVTPSPAPSVPRAPAAPEAASAPAVAWQGTPAPRAVEERFLRQARADLNHRTCESYLVGLGELAEQSRVRPFREEARYLRARCHEVRFSPDEAAAEYRLYLREFPRGRWAREARVALLP